MVGRTDEDDTAALLTEIREGLAARGELADDYTDDELRYSLRVTLLALAIDTGARFRRLSTNGHSGYPP
jgi:hypothetical protein